MLRKFHWKRQQRNSAAQDLSQTPPSSDTDTDGTLNGGSTLKKWHKKTTTTVGNSTPDLGSSRLSLNTIHRDLSPHPDGTRQRLGLQMVHEPSPSAPLDIIFVHGLGGDSRKTWCKDHNEEFFWPGLWLPFDPEIGTARIMSFGYNANFGVGAPKSISNIADFAKELLFDMNFSKNEKGESLDIGRVPIIFVVHSMGGLVVKKAYILGQNDEAYQNIVRSISAIVFLATPHHGTNLAETLNSILKVSFQSTRNFIADLAKSSSALEEVNEQFRHIAPKLSIFSFYETLATSIGLKKIMVVEKNSSLLGSKMEFSRALNADHHGVCKYDNPEDINYVSVRNALRTLVGRFRPKGVDLISNRKADEAKDIQNLFGITGGSEDDLIRYRRRWITGTCGWLLEEPVIQLWLDQTSSSNVVWFTAPPGSGKTFLSTHMISHLLENKMSCQYFFFKYADQKDRSLSTLLRSIASQVAYNFPEFRRILATLSSEGLKLEQADSTFIWQKIFLSILFQMDFGQPLFWIFDAVDESESPKALFELLHTLPSSRTPVRLLLFSRKTEPLLLAVNRLSDSMKVDMIEKNVYGHNSLDIQLLVDRELKHMRGTDELKRQIKQSIMGRASGNFLWVQLVLEDILSCQTEEAIKETLEEIPDDMNTLYQRMEASIVNHPRKSNSVLAKAFFTWIICASRSLTLLELSQALKPEFPEFIDFRRTIQDVCGQFVLVDQSGRLELVHKTARDYLVQTCNTTIAVDTKEGHTQLFHKCIMTLLEPKLQFKLTHGEHALRSTEPFLFYAATSWVYHLRQAPMKSDHTLDILIKLLASPSILTWIHSLALINRLEVLVKASKALTKFTTTARKLNATKNPLLHRLSDLELLDMWAVDLVKVVGKFNAHLLSNPLAIYELVPPLCPTRSIIHRQFHKSRSSALSISGIANDSWDDNYARINLPNGDRAWQIVCAGLHVAVLCSSGDIPVWLSSNFTAVCILQHHEPVTAISFNSKGDKLVTYGLRSTKLWAIPSGQLLLSTINPADSRAMTIVFAEADTKILAAGVDRVIRYICASDFVAGWQVLDPALLEDVYKVDGAVIGSPMGMAFNGDSTQIGVCYRGFPLSVWSLAESRCIGRCKRAKDFRKDQTQSSKSWFAVDRFTWNPVSGHIIGIYRDGCLFKWHPLSDENQEVQSAADEISASPDGKLFVTSDSNGTVKVWSFAYFSVIYQLSSTDLVTGLSFSPDSRRFYDLRGCVVNAWESNSLLRFAETEESFSDVTSEDQTPSSISQVSEACLTEYDAVSTLAATPNSPFYCFGNEEGAVELVDVRNGKSIELMKFLNYLSVSHLSWGKDGSHIAAADLGGDVIIKKLDLPDFSECKAGLEFRSLPSPKINLEGWGIHQIMFNHDSSLLLVVSEDRGQIWGVGEAALITAIALENGASRRWLTHPSRNDSFMGFGENDVVIFSWDGFKKKSRRQYQEARPCFDSKASSRLKNETLNHIPGLSTSSNPEENSTSLVSKAMLTQDGKHVLVQIKETSMHGRVSKRCLIFDTSGFYTDDETPLIYNFIPRQIISSIDIPLGVLPGWRLVFLDQDLWICTYKLKAMFEDGALQRNYFIPRNWASTDGLEQCCMLENGTFLCPKDDKVVVIEGDLEGRGF